jgi:hypothetical protein
VRMIEVRTGIALRDGDQLHLGTVLRLRANMAGIVTEAELAPGTQVEIEIELDGFGQHVTGRAEVRRVELRPGRPNRYLLRIDTMPLRDRRLLQAWYEHNLGIESSIASAQLAAVAQSAPSAPPPSPAMPSGPLLEEPRLVRSGKRRMALRGVLEAAIRGLEGKKRGQD